MKAFSNPFSTSSKTSHTISRGTTGAGQKTFTPPSNTNRKDPANSPAPLKSRCASCR